MQAQVVLTVSESKRLIAKGLASYEPVKAALEEGTVAVAKGSTNAYVVEELTGEKIEKTHYMTGSVFPAKAEKKGKVKNALPDLVLKGGRRVEGLSATDALKDMGEGDVFLKGVNAINYALGQAALLIGHPTGGTIGAAAGIVIARRVRLIIPAGLEKSVPADLAELASVVGEPEEKLKSEPTLWLMQGELFTEIEALEVLAGVDGIPMAAGGIGGAEGSVRLLLAGSEENVRKAVEIVESLQGEPPFIA